MGRQINFYIEKELEDKFMQKIFEDGFVVVAEDLENKKLVKFNELSEVNPQIHILYLYKENYGQIITDKEYEYRLDCLRSPVIEFTKTLIKYEKKIIIRGRLWVESKFYDKNGVVVNKDSRLISEYNLLAKWVKKNVPYQDILKGDYIVKEYITNRIKELSNCGFKLM